MALRHFCEECGSTADVTKFVIRADLLNPGEDQAEIPHVIGEDLPGYERDLCGSCLSRRIEEFSEFIDGLNKQRPND
jgi:hypothetical protein